MINMQNQGSKEILAVKSKARIYTKLCLKLRFESSWYFCNILSQDDFESDCAERTSLKSLQKQPYADVLQNRCS